jgi:hypothetical protein
LLDLVRFLPPFLRPGGDFFAGTELDRELGFQGCGATVGQKV